MHPKLSRRSVLSMGLGGVIAGPGVLARGLPLRAISLQSRDLPPPVGLNPYETVDPDHKMEVVRFKAQDGTESRGILHLPRQGKPEVVVVEIHPESDTGLDWRFPYYTRAGIAGLGIHHRYIMDDKNLIIEEVMLDMAAALKYLKDERGFKRVVLLGHSGGGSTVSFYQSQAEKKPPQRVKQSASGDPPNLNEFDLPPADGLIVSAAHWGRGWTVLHRIDPSVTDETDPLSVDPDLDMYNPDNGFKTPPAPSKYSLEFVQKYTAAQEARMQRLIAKAREHVREQKMAKELVKDPFFSRRSAWEQTKIQRAAITERIMTIYRKEASLKYTDLSLDPNDRVVGSNNGPRPDLRNYIGGFHPQPIKPQAFLSSESIASNVNMVKDIKTVSVPTLVMCGTADMNEWPTEQKQTYEAAGAKDKEIVWILGANHPYLPSGPKSGERDQRDRAGDSLNRWIKKRFGS